MEKNKLKICLYLEYYHLFGGFFYKKIGTGLLSSYENQKKILTRLGIEYTLLWDDSCDILQINTPWLRSLFLIKSAHRKGKKVIIWSHVTAEDIKGVFRLSFLLSPIAKKYLTYAYNQADLIFSPSEYTKTLLIAYGIPASKIVAMTNGVDTTMFSHNQEKRELVRKEYNLDGIVFGTVGLAIPRKGVNTFLSLASVFPHNKFMWFGKIYSALVAQSLPKVMPQNVTFSGYVDDISASFNTLDVFLFPSYEENQGMVILEAAATGLPLLVRDIPVYSSWLFDGENCLKAKNDEEFKQKLEILKNDEGVRTRIGQAGLSMVLRDHSLQAVGEKLKMIYNRL